MRSRAARLTLGAATWLAIGAAVVVLVTFERQTSAARDGLLAFDQRSHDAAETLSDLRVGQQAYVATGQGVGFWMPRVGATMDTAAETLTALRRSATSPEAVAAIDEAASAIVDLRSVDARARDYLENGQPLMAGDVVFSEGDQASVRAAQAVQRARLAEQVAFEAAESGRRRLEAIALATTAGIAALAVLLLVPTTAAPEAHATEDAVLETAGESAKPASQATPSSLTKVAALCTDFGRVRDVDELQRLLSRTAEVMDASGVMVWLGDAAGADLRPILAHGYPAAALERMPSVPRSADNAAAAAYRTGRLQIVLAESGRSTGAIVAPVLTSEGCIGALSAETKGGAEVSGQNQAVAALVAAHLATVLGPAAASTPAAGTMAPAESEARAAAG